VLAENKDPSGGTTGRVKPYGRLGWMGARAEYSLDGEGLPLPPVLVAEGHPDVQRWFKNFWLTRPAFLNEDCLSRPRICGLSARSPSLHATMPRPRSTRLLRFGRAAHSSSVKGGPFLVVTAGASARCQPHSTAIRVDRREQLLQGTYRRHTKPFVEINGGGMFVPNRRKFPCEIGVRSKRLVNHAGIARIQRAVCVPRQQHFDFTWHSFSQSIAHCHHGQPRSTPAASAVRPVSCVHRTGAPLRFSPTPAIPAAFSRTHVAVGDRRSRGVLPIVRSSTYATHHSTCMASRLAGAIRAASRSTAVSQDWSGQGGRRFDLECKIFRNTASRIQTGVPRRSPFRAVASMAGGQKSIQGIIIRLPIVLYGCAPHRQTRQIPASGPDSESPPMTKRGADSEHSVQKIPKLKAFFPKVPPSHFTDVGHEQRSFIASRPGFR
jgi:hypothetical protein